jgi:hypothetical protein
MWVFAVAVALLVYVVYTFLSKRNASGEGGGQARLALFLLLLSTACQMASRTKSPRLIRNFVFFQRMPFFLQKGGAVSRAGGGGAAAKDAGAAKSNKPRISFYFGSQTGTAEGFAQELATSGDENAFDIRVVDMEDLDPDEDLAADAVSVFIVATSVIVALLVPFRLRKWSCCCL